MATRSTADNSGFAPMLIGLVRFIVCVSFAILNQVAPRLPIALFSLDQSPSVLPLELLLLLELSESWSSQPEP